MTIGKKILHLRKELNLTQSQIAEAVGVSTPAVSKWETDATLPDVSLLGPIARKLGTDLNSLLSFTQELSPIETDQLMHKLIQLFNTKGFNSGAKACLKSVNEYPNNYYLKFKVAVNIRQYKTLLDIDCSKSQLARYDEEIIRLLTEVSHASLDPNMSRIKNAAIRTLSTIFIETNRFEEAEQLLYPLPRKVLNGRERLKSVYLKLGDTYEAKSLAQTELLVDLEHLLIDLLTLFKSSLLEGSTQKAYDFANDFYNLASLIRLPAYSPSLLRVEYFLAQKDISGAQEAFKSMIDEIITSNLVFTSSKYYDVIKDSLPTMSKILKKDYRIAMYKEIVDNPLYDDLLQTAPSQKALNELKHVVDV